MATLTQRYESLKNTNNTPELDVLIPPPINQVKKFFASIIAMAATLFLVVVINRGYVHPAAFASDDYVGAQFVGVDKDDGLFAVEVRLANTGARTVRLVDVAVDAPGAELARATLADPAHQQPATRNVFTVERADDSRPEGRPVPAEVAPVDHDFYDNHYTLTLWLRPTSCETIGSSWGDLEVTVDFGDSSLPPFSATTRFERPLWSERSNGQPGRSTSIWTSGGRVEGDGPLEAACEALR